MSAKIANRKKKHKIFAKYFSHPRSPHHHALCVSWLFAKLFCGGLRIN